MSILRFSSSEESSTTNADSTLGLQQQMDKLSIIEPAESNEGPVHPKPTDEATNSTTISESTAYTGPHFPPGYLQVIEEPTEYLAAEFTYAKNLLKRYQRDNPDVERTLSETAPDLDEDKTRKGCKRKGGGKVSHSEAEGYERVTPKHGDKAFQKFQKQLAKCPQQLLR